MNTLEQNPIEKNEVAAQAESAGVEGKKMSAEELAAELKDMPKSEVRAMVTPMLMPGEQLSDLDIAMIVNYAINEVLKGQVSDKEKAILDGAGARTEANKIPEGPAVHVVDEKGNVVASGANEVDAMKSAQEETRG